MKTKRDILDPTTDQDELIIDSETVTQWVDSALSVPHEASVDSLAAKFPSLKHYGEDASEIRSLLQASYKADIKAPADTAARVLKAIKSELPPAKEPLTTPSEPIASTPVSAEDPTTIPPSVTHEPFILSLPPEKKKRHAYVWPIAALLFLMAFVASVVHIELEKDQQLAQEGAPSSSQNVSKVKKTRKALIMSSEADRHTLGNNEAHLTTYTLDKVGESKKEKDNDEDKKDDQKKDEDKDADSSSPQKTPLPPEDK